MLKNYFKIALRNLAKHKGYSFINISGLAVGIACCMLIFLYVKDELTFDRFQSKADRVYRINSIIDWFGNKDTMGATNRLEAKEYAERVPEIEAFTRFQSASVVVQKGEEWLPEYGTFYTDEGTFKMFDFQVLSGSFEGALDELNSIVISRRIAEKFFDVVDVAGRELRIKLEGKVEQFVVQAVYEDLPSNSSLYADALLPWKKYDSVSPLDKPSSAWSSVGNTSFIMVRSPETDIPALEKKIKEVRHLLNPDEENDKWARGIDSQLQLLTDIHYAGVDSNSAVKAPGNPTYSYVLSGIGLLILILACINFANLSVARSLPRAKEIGLRKVLGAQKKQVAIQFLGEALYVSCISFVLGLILAELFLPTFANLTNKEFGSGIIQDTSLIIACFGLVALSAFLAGAYPAFFVARFSILKSLNGKVQMSGKQYITKALVTFQFAIAALLVIGTMAMYQQISFLLNTDLGYDDKNLGSMSFYGSRDQANVLLSEVNKDPNILSASLNNGFGSATGMGYQGEEFFVTFNPVDTSYIEVMGLQLVSGRNLKHNSDFYIKSSGDTLRNILVTEKFLEKAKIDVDPIGLYVTSGGGDDAKDEYRIVGVLKDFIYSSAKYEIAPVAFSSGNALKGNYASLMLRFREGYSTEIKSALTEVWRKVDPYSPLRFSFQEESNKSSYFEEKRWRSIITSASVIAIIISCLGLFGMAHLSTQQRQKEIGVRKVLGASIKELVYMLNVNFAKLVIISALIAIPVAYYFLDDWLSNFAFRIELGIWVFLIPTLLTFLIALSTVSIQSIKTANANPVDSLRSE